MPRFEWNKRKAASNLAKHKVSFDDAQQAFDDPHGLEGDASVDPETREQRWYLIGASSVGLLVVVYVEREAVRIISARKATKNEKVRYQRGT